MPTNALIRNWQQQTRQQAYSYTEEDADTEISLQETNTPWHRYATLTNMIFIPSLHVLPQIFAGAVRIFRLSHNCTKLRCIRRIGTYPVRAEPCKQPGWVKSVLRCILEARLAGDCEVLSDCALHYAAPTPMRNCCRS